MYVTYFKLVTMFLFQGVLTVCTIVFLNESLILKYIIMYIRYETGGPPLVGHSTPTL